MELVEGVWLERLLGWIYRSREWNWDWNVGQARCFGTKQTDGAVFCQLDARKSFLGLCEEVTGDASIVADGALACSSRPGKSLVSESGDSHGDDSPFVDGDAAGGSLGYTEGPGETRGGRLP